MSKKYLLPLIVVFLSTLMLLACTPLAPQYPPYTPDKESGNGGFDFPSNSYSADVVLDGYLTDEGWQQEGVVSLGSWDETDVESGVYGAIVADSSNYAGTKRAIIKMFRGTVGLHFGFEVKDSDLAYKELSDGDPAIWTDNVLVNLCTSIDGATIPMSDDYYFIVTAFGNNCFRRGANAAGMWGAWSGVIDYESAIHYDKDGETVLGFGVELVIPYEQIGITAESPVGVTFRSCDRISANNSMIEREWWFNDSVHHFNTPNGYAIWGADNLMYNYYDYQMPEVSVKGTVTDYITGEALANVDLGNGIVADEKGNFLLEKVNANSDLVLTASGENLLGEQTFTLSRDKMRVANGGTVIVTPAFLTVKNKVTQTVKGVISSIGKAQGATVTIGENSAVVAEDGSYSLECTFTSPIMKMTVTPENSNANYDFEISVNEAVKGAVIRDIELPLMTKLPMKFGNSNDAETLLGWTSEGLFVRITGESVTNGYGVAYSVDGESAKVVLYHDFGTMCITDFAKLVWNYALPEAHGVDAYKYQSAEGKNVYTFVLPYEVMGITGAQDISIAPFEYTSAGPFSWYSDENGRTYQFGSMDLLEGYPVLTANAEYKVSISEKVINTYESEVFGKSSAVAKFEQIESLSNGVRVTINYTPASGLFGFGVMMADANAVAFTQLYAVGFGTIDHKVYGDWAWGSYDIPSAYGVEASLVAGETHTVLTLFYSYETLANYGLNITSESEMIKLQLFEYVTDGTGNLFGCYNCMNVNGEPLRFDTSLENFVTWRVKESAPEQPEDPEQPEQPEVPELPEAVEVYESEVFGNSSAVAKFQIENGVKVTITYTPNSAVFGFGVMMADANGVAFTQLYAVGFGTIDHKVYGDWAWAGNYQAPSVHGVVASEVAGETQTVVTLFYSYETLASYGLNITSETEVIKLQLFEYVTDGTGNLFGCYNCMNVNGVPYPFDAGVANFVTWQLKKAEEPEQPEVPEQPSNPVIFTYEDLGEHQIDVKLEKGETGITVTYTAVETSNLFGYGICLDLPDGATDLSILFATTGNIAKLTYGNWLWVYELPATHNIVASRETNEGVTTASIFLSYEMLGISAQAQSVGICLFEVVNAGGAQYGIYNCMLKGETQVIIDGGVGGFVTWNLQ